MIDLSLTRNTMLAACAAFLLSGALAQAQEAATDDDGYGEEEEWFLEYLYEPEVVLLNWVEIEMTAEQRDALIDNVVEIQSAVTRSELEMLGLVHQIDRLLLADPIDAGAVLPLVDQLLESENAIKRQYLTLMIELHNDLTPAQRAELDAIYASYDTE